MTSQLTKNQNAKPNGFFPRFFSSFADTSDSAKEVGISIVAVVIAEIFVMMFFGLANGAGVADTRVNNPVKQINNGGGHHIDEGDHHCSA